MKLARQKGLEPLTYRLEGGCSIQLSYKRIHIKDPIFLWGQPVERVMGIEPTSPAWKAGILAVEQHPHLYGKRYITILPAVSQPFFNYFLEKISELSLTEILISLIAFSPFSIMISTILSSIFFRILFLISRAPALPFLLISAIYS